MTDTTHPSRRAGLRDEIARALEAADYRMDMRRGDLADAVLPVLYREWPWLRAEAAAASVVVPAADRAALSARLWKIAEHHIVAEWICCEPVQPGHDLCAQGYAALGMVKTLLVDGDPEKAWNPSAPLLDAVLGLPAPADRAAEARVRALHQQYRFAGDDTTDYCSHCNQISGGWIPWPCPTIRALDAVESAAVDRVAAETEAHPAEHTWAAELHDPLADEWVPGTRYPVRDRAVNALNHAKRLGPEWADGTPTERRLVRATTTYTVEEPDGPVVEAQPGKDTETQPIPDGRCPACGHTVCDGDGPCGARSGSDFCTCPGLS